MKRFLAILDGKKIKKNNNDEPGRVPPILAGNLRDAKSRRGYPGEKARCGCSYRFLLLARPVCCGLQCNRGRRPAELLILAQ